MPESMITGTLVEGARYDVQSLDFVRWVDRDGNQIDNRSGPNPVSSRSMLCSGVDKLDPWLFFDRNDVYLGATDDGVQPVFEVELTLRDDDLRDDDGYPRG